MDGKEVKRRLPVGVEGAELAAFAEELAKKLIERDATEVEFALLKKRWKDDLDAMSDRIRHVQQVVADEAEERNVRCLWQDNGDLTVSLVRLDTGEVVETRAMTAEERQRPIPIDSEARR